MSETIKYVEDKILWLKKQGVVHCNELGKNGKVIWASDFKEVNDDVTLIFRTGQEPDVEDHEITFKGVLIDKVLAESFSKTKKDIKLKVTENQAQIINEIIKPKMEAEKTNNNFTGLRKILFETIRKVESKQMSSYEAKVISSTAQVIINSVKVELEFKLKATKMTDEILVASKMLD